MIELIVNGYLCLFDEDDFDKFSSDKFSIVKGWNKTPYLSIRLNGKSTLYHRLITNAPKNRIVDHKNHNTLDNRKENLRLCTRSQNMWNRKRTTGTSKYKGVYWWTERNGWASAIYLNNKRIYLGVYNSEKKAAEIYNQKAKELFGEFACLNTIT